MVRVDGSQAHFVDSDRNKWYFDSGRRLWREMDIMDFHPMALQFTRPEKPEKSVFDSTEDAALAALKVFFRQSVELDEPLDADMRVKYQSYTNRKRELLNLITDMENTQDINIKAKLRNKIAENL